jgi:hypothetical protein
MWVSRPGIATIWSRALAVSSLNAPVETLSDHFPRWGEVMSSGPNNGVELAAVAGGGPLGGLAGAVAHAER